MSSKENRTKYLFILSVINALTIISGIFMSMSNILINSKYGFITAAFVAATVADCIIIGYRDKSIENMYFKKYSDTSEETEKYKERMLETIEERDILKSQLEYYTSGKIKEEYDAMKQKCVTIENFRNSFPYKITDGYVLYNIMRTDLQAGTSSTWKIVGDYNGELWECNIVRPNNQSYKELLALSVSTSEPSQIAALNLGQSLLWE